MAANDEIFGLLERTIASYEVELSQTREKNESQQPEAVSKTQVVLLNEDVQQLIGPQDRRPPQQQAESPTMKQENPQPPHIKEEQEELCINQGGERTEEADLTKLLLTDVSVKTEEHEDKPPESPQSQHSPSKEKSGAEPPSGSSTQRMTTETDGDYRGGSQGDHLLAPLSDIDDTTSHCPENEDRDDTREALSSDADCEGDVTTDTDNKHAESSQKKTAKKCFTCPFCDKSFSHKFGLTRHMRAHKGEKPFSCSVCSQTFSRNDILIKHRTTHTEERPFMCSVCGKGFSTKSNITVHMRTHTGETPYSCSVCAKTFTQHNSLTAHMRTHTGEKPFGCSVCNRSFSTKSNMVKHMRTHTGEKPFGCSICGRTLISKASLIGHQRTHSGEKPYSCSICGKMISSKSGMAKHMRTHTGEKPYSCSLCAKPFTRHDNLMAHMRLHNQQ